MFAIELKKFQVWLRIAALLLLSYSVSISSCYPQTEDDEDPTEADQNLDNEEDGEEAGDEEEESSQEGEDTDVENADNTRNFNAERTCVVPMGDCGPTENPGRLLCCRDVVSRDFFRCEKWLQVGDYYKCTRILPEAVQQAMKAWAAVNGFP